jgi:hypothetical protein
MAIALCNITGLLLDSGGFPASGNLIFKPSGLIYNSNSVIVKSHVFLIENGQINISVPESETSGITYEIYFQGLEETPTEYFRFYSKVPNKSTMEFVELIPSGISANNYQTSINEIVRRIYLLLGNSGGIVNMGVTYKGAYNNLIGYTKGDIVVYQGTTYLNTQDTVQTGVSPEPPNATWGKLGITETPVISVAGKTGTVVLESADIDTTDNSRKFITKSLLNKLTGIEANATADQTPLELVTALSSLTGTDRLDASAIKNLPSGSGGSVDSVNGLTGAVILTPDNIDDSNTVDKFISTSNLLKLTGIEANATADQTPLELVTALSSLTGNDRLDASAIKNLPSGSGGSLYYAEFMSDSVQNGAANTWVPIIYNIALENNIGISFTNNIDFIIPQAGKYYISVHLAVNARERGFLNLKRNNGLIAQCWSESHDFHLHREININQNDSIRLEVNFETAWGTYVNLTTYPEYINNISFKKIN